MALRRSGWLLLALLVFVPASQAGVRGGSPVALVTAPTLNQLVAVELPSGRVVQRIPMPPEPESVTAVGSTSVVVSPASGTVTLLNGLDVQRVFRGFAAAHIAALSPDGEWAYVTDDARGTLTAFELAHPRVIWTIHVGAGAHQIAVAPDLSQLWIALGERARRIAVVDTSDMAHPRLAGFVDPHGLAHDLAFTPRGDSVWVTYDDRSSIGVLDARTGRLRRLIPAGRPPQHIAFDPFTLGRHAYVTSGAAGTLRIFDLRTGRLLRLVHVARGSYNLGLSGGLVATSSMTNGTLTELDGNGRHLLTKKVAPTAQDVAVAVLP